MEPKDFVVPSKKAATPLVEEVSRAFAEIAASSTSAEVKLAVSNLKIVNVKEIDVVETGKKALVVFVPYVAFKTYAKPQQARIIAELEKKTKRHVALIAHRNVLKKNVRPIGHSIRPRSRCLTEVRKGMLQDMVGAVDIVGRRIIYQPDGQRIVKIELDLKEKNKENLEEKLSTFAAMHRTLFSSKAEFCFPEYTL